MSAADGSSKGYVGRGVARWGYRKNVDTLLAEASSKHGLAKTLTGKNLVMLGVAGIIGGGIFVLVGSGIVKAGVMVVPAFIVAAAICAVAGFAYAELASSIPASGSAYAYIYTAMGELPGWMVAWALILEYAVGAVSVAVACRNNLLAVITQFGHLFNRADAAITAQWPHGVQYFANADNPFWYSITHSPLESGTALNAAGQAVTLQGWVNLPSILIVAIVTAILVKGTKESARFTSVLVVAKVAILLFAIGVAFTLFDPHNLADPLPHYTTPNGSLYDARSFAGGLQAVFAAAAVMFFAYIGFDSVSTTAEETKNPKKDLPVGILGSLGISTLLYILAAGALVGAAHWSLFVGDSTAAQAARGEPFGYVFEAHHSLEIGGFSIGALLVRLGALIGTTSVLLVLILGGVRVFFNMSRDGLLPTWMSRISPRGNPTVTTLFYGAFTLVFAGLLTLDAAVELVNIGTLFAFLMVILATWVFRARRPDVERPFRMPMWPARGAWGWLLLGLIAAGAATGIVFMALAAKDALAWTIVGVVTLVAAGAVMGLVAAQRRSGSLPLFALLGMLGTLALVFSLDKFTLLASVTWAGLGLLVYAFYGVGHSREARERHAQVPTETGPARVSLTVATRGD